MIKKIKYSCILISVYLFQPGFVLAQEVSELLNKKNQLYLKNKSLLCNQQINHVSTIPYEGIWSIEEYLKRNKWTNYKKVKFSHNGKYLATEIDLGKIRLRQIYPKTKNIKTINYELSFFELKFSPNGEYLIITSWDDSMIDVPNGAEAKLIETSTGKEITTIVDKGWIDKIEFSLDSKYLATIAKYDQVRLFNVSDGQEIYNIEYESRIKSIKSSPNNKYLVIKKSNNQVKLIQASTGQEIATISHESSIKTIDFSPNSKYLYTVGYDHKLKLIKTSKGKEIAVISHEAIVDQIEFSLDSKYLATKTRDKKAKLIKVSKGKIITTEEEANEIKFSPNNKYLAVNGRNRKAKLLITKTGQKNTNITQEDIGNEIEFSPDGKYLLSIGSEYKKVKLIKISTGQKIATFSYQDPVNYFMRTIEFSPNGDYLIVVEDEKIKLIYIPTGQEIYQLFTDSLLNTYGIQKLQFSEDKNFLAIVYTSGMAKAFQIKYCHL